MKVKTYSKLLHLLETAMTKSGELHTEMKAILKHADENFMPTVSPFEVQRSSGEIYDALSSAIKELRQIGVNVLNGNGKQD